MIRASAIQWTFESFASHATTNNFLDHTLQVTNNPVSGVHEVEDECLGGVEVMFM